MMKLSQLAAATGTSTATIKYWIREQIVPPGTLRNQTTAVYNDSHQHRIRLIRTLRERFDQPIADVRLLTEMLDDQTVPIIAVMDACQRIAAGLGSVDADADVDGGPQQDTVSDLLRRTGWPDVSSTARAALVDTLRAVENDGVPFSADRLAAYATALAGIADDDIAFTRESATEEPDPPRDEIARRVLVGTSSQMRILLAMNNLAHASAAIREGRRT